MINYVAIVINYIVIVINYIVIVIKYIVIILKQMFFNIFLLLIKKYSYHAVTDGVTLPMHGRQTVHRNGTLSITDVVSADQGVYACTVEGQTTSANLQVKGEPSHRDIKDILFKISKKNV